MRSAILTLLLIPLFTQAQMMTASQQKALNAQVDYANQSADEITAVVKGILDYYPSILQKRSWGIPRYSCPVQPDEYYFNAATTALKNLPPANSAPIGKALNLLREEAMKIDARCKALDTYHKLEDYKKDDFSKAKTIVQEIVPLLKAYKAAQEEFENVLGKTFLKLNAGARNTTYGKADAAMRRQVVAERTLLDQWTLNALPETHTGWPVEKLEASIPQTDLAITSLKNMKLVIKYPASSMWEAFPGALASVLDGKRRGLDGYNFEAKKSDEHSNDVYLELINYFNGAVLSDYNMFIQWAQADGYQGLKAIKYFPLFEIRTMRVTTEVTVKPFVDTPHQPFTITPIKAAIPKNTFEALTQYIEYVNETWRQVNRMQGIINSFNSSAAYYRTIDDYSRHGAMNFDFKDFELPLSHYQKVVLASKSIPAEVSKSLNAQAEVLLNILKEMNDQCAWLDGEVKAKRYETDHLDKTYKMIERMAALFTTWDDRKETLYNDVRKCYDSYTVLPVTNHWYISGVALHNLTDLDREQLFNARSYYRGNTSVSITTDKIDGALREVIAREYDNMKGIEKIGRNNGNCPYTPYEDLPQTSKTFSESLQNLKAVKATGIYQHPYHALVYLYNDVVDDHNKFCELSVTAPLLKTVKQPEFFTIEYPKSDSPTRPSTQSEVPTARQAPQVDPPTKSADKSSTASSTSSTSSKTQTKVVHDTVYIEKRDTVYLSQPGETLRSMEGYAVNNMVLLLDVSGSMNTPDKLPMLKQSVLDLLSMMRKEDKVSIIAFSGKPKAVLQGISFKDEGKIREAIENLKSSGKTDGDAALNLAYKVANGEYVRAGNNRIILATDGEFVLNDETLALIAKSSGEDVYLTIFNFGKGMGSSKTLEKLAGLGKGNYEYISKDNIEIKLIREAKAKRLH